MATAASCASFCCSFLASRRDLVPRALPMLAKHTSATSSRFVFTHMSSKNEGQKCSKTISLDKEKLGKDTGHVFPHICTLNQLNGLVGFVHISNTQKIAEIQHC